MAGPVDEIITIAPTFKTVKVEGPESRTELRQFLDAPETEVIHRICEEAVDWRNIAKVVYQSVQVALQI